MKQSWVCCARALMSQSFVYLRASIKSGGKAYENFARIPNVSVVELCDSIFGLFISTYGFIWTATMSVTEFDRKTSDENFLKQSTLLDNFIINIYLVCGAKFEKTKTTRKKKFNAPWKQLKPRDAMSLQVGWSVSLKSVLTLIKAINWAAMAYKSSSNCSS